MSEKKATKAELAKQIKRLEAELRRLRSPSPDASEPAGSEGVAEGVVITLGKMVPGLQKLIDLAAKMPEFHDRLASIDEEIKRKFKEQPLRQASAGLTGRLGRRRVGIPPSVRRRRTTRSGSAGTGTTGSSGKRSRRGSYREPGPPKVHISPETPEQLPIDVFDEGDHLAVLAEAHGLKRQEITVSLEGSMLDISVDAPHRKGSQHVQLPCTVAGEPKVSLAKGILKIQMDKADTK